MLRFFFVGRFSFLKVRLLVDRYFSCRFCAEGAFDVTPLLFSNSMILCMFHSAAAKISKKALVLSKDALKRFVSVQV